MANSKKSYSRISGFHKVLDSQDIKSFVDLKLKSDSSLVKVKGDTLTGLVSGTDYVTEISIASTPQELTIAGEDASTITALVDAINDSITGASAFFIEEEEVIRIQTSASGTTEISVVDGGTLVDGLVGTSAIKFTASYRAPVVGGGVQVQLSNTATTDNPIDAVVIAQAISSVGVSKSLTKVYDRETGAVTITGTFVAGDEIDMISSFVK